MSNTVIVLDENGLKRLADHYAAKKIVRNAPGLYLRQNYQML